MRLRLIRHPKPVIAANTCYGQLDIPPDDDDMAALLLRLRATPVPARVYSSPLQRCLRVAVAMHRQHAWPEPVIDRNLAEMSFGQWEGRNWDDIGHGALEQWRQNMADHVPPGGESVRQLAQRALAFVNNLEAAELAGNLVMNDKSAIAPGREPLDIAVFTHAGIIQTMPRIWRGQELSGFSSTRIGYGSVTELVLGR